MKDLESRENTGFESFFWFILLLFAVFILNACDKENIEAWENEVEQLKLAVAPLKDFDTAKSKGYDIKATEYRTQMGFHYLNADLLDETFDVENPEVLIFIETASGGMELVAVEYGVPIKDLDNPPPPPEGYSGSEDVWKIDAEFSLWTLHVWVPMENPEGIFTPRNPMLP
ncbi:hypothetical protein [Maribacter sp. 2210JD10-5]|uniref:hypothetical protein n=1 Tax=Maribacter sp. 2210JD10-5 TaxID=3386272 RepID=UPI0039BCF426